MASAGISSPAAASSAAGPPKNIYHKRQVAEASAKPCFICYKPSVTVLITPDSRDFFYACVGHLSDRGFASPIGEDAGATAAKKPDDTELQREIDKVKAEYEAKAKKRKARAKAKESGKKKVKDDDDDIKPRDKDKDASSDDEAADAKARDDKVAALEKQKSTAATAEGAEKPKNDGPRVFALHKSIFQMRLTKMYAAVNAKKNQERARNPLSFPAVPKNLQ